MIKVKMVLLILALGAIAFAETPNSLPQNLPHLSLDREGAPELTLERSIEFALKNATTVLKAKNAVEQTGMQLLQSYAQFLPNLVGSANYSYNNGNNYYTQSVPTFVTSESNGATYAVTSTLNIFNGLADISGLKSSVKKDEAAELSLKRAKQQISLDVSQSFLQVVLDRQLVKIAAENLSRSQARERLFSEQAKVGSRSLADLYRQQAQTSSDESSLLSSESKLREDQVFLLQKLRLDVSKNYKFTDPPFRDVESGDARFSNEDKLMEEALHNRVDLRAADLRANASDYDVSVVEAAYLPQLNFGAMLSSSSRTLTNQMVGGVNDVPANQNSQWNQLQNQSNYTFGLTLTWTFFDRLVTPVNVQNAKVTADNLSIDAQDQKLAVEGEVRRAYGTYQTAIEQLHSSRRGLTAAEKAYDVVLGRYNVGSANFVDLTTAQSTLVQAQSFRADALIGYILQSKTMEFALGKTPTN